MTDEGATLQGVRLTSRSGGQVTLALCVWVSADPSHKADHLTGCLHCMNAQLGNNLRRPTMVEFLSKHCVSQTSGLLLVLCFLIPYSGINLEAYFL